MKKILSGVLLLLSFTLHACESDGEDPAPQRPVEKPDNGSADDSYPTPPARIRITVGAASFTVRLEDNATAAALIARLPMTVEMAEHNGNEKYYNLPQQLPTSVTYPGKVVTGDLMLFGADCLVLFYKNFPTSYGYTPIGWMENTQGLAAALGQGRVHVRFETITEN